MFIIMNPKELRRTSRLSLKTKKHRYAVRKRSSIQVEWLPDVRALVWMNDNNPDRCPFYPKDGLN